MENTGRRAARTFGARRAWILAAILFLASERGLAAQDGPSGDRSGFLFAEYGLAWEPGGIASDDAPGSLLQELAFSAPIAMVGGGVFRLTGDLTWLDQEIDRTFPESGAAAPRRVAKARLGTDFTRRYSKGWVSQTGISVFSSGETLSGSDNALSFAANGMLMVPARNSDAWIFLLVYAPMEIDFPFPIPLASYRWEPSDTFRMGIGLPFLLDWRPRRRLVLRTSYVPIMKIAATAELGLPPEPLSLLLSFRNADEKFSYAEEDGEDVTLHAAKASVTTGLRLAFLKRCSATIGGSYILDHALTLGDRASGDDRIDLGSGFALDFTLRFGL